MSDLVEFENLFSELNEIIPKLENPDITLSESVELYKRGVGLAVRCDEILRNAKQEIEIIRKEKQIGLSDNDDEELI